MLGSTTHGEGGKISLFCSALHDVELKITRSRHSKRRQFFRFWCTRGAQPQGTPPKVTQFELHNLSDAKNQTPNPAERQWGVGLAVNMSGQHVCVLAGSSPAPPAVWVFWHLI
jgi:hypothetical protein